MLYRRIFAIPDVHFPWHHRRALRWTLNTIKEMKPTKDDAIVQLGDLYDWFSRSRFSKTLRYTPDEEAKLGRQYAKEFWAELRAGAPKARLIQIMGNHDDRPLKRQKENAPENYSDYVAAHQARYHFKTIETHHDSDHLVVLPTMHGKVCFQHGNYARLGDHVRYNLLNTVCGHTHRGGVWYEARENQTLWELNAGYLADPNSEVCRYSPTTFKKWTLGFGLYDELGPRFIPYRGKA